MTTVYANLMTPRSGSTLVQLMAYHYLQSKYNNCINLKNYFNKFHYNMYFKPLINSSGAYIGKKNHTQYVPGSYREEALLDNKVNLIYNYNVNGNEPIRDIEEETLHRLNCIKNSNIGWTYCFKLHAFPELNPVYEYAIGDNWLIICTERNEYTQVLEYFISMDMQTWAFFESSSKEIKKHLPKKESISVDKNKLVAFLERIKFYQQTRDRFANKIVIKYSDLEKVTNVWDVYRLLNFNDWEQYIHKDKVIKELPVKIPFGNLEKYFSNINEIKEWYSEWTTTNRIH